MIGPGLIGSRGQGWAISFADLALLLLGCFVILYSTRSAEVAPEAEKATASENAPGFAAPSASLFEPGEARLSPHGRAELAAFGRKAAARGEGISVQGVGREAASRRFDGWELAAARTAAAARAVAEGGVPEEWIDVAMTAGAGEGPDGHRIELRLGRKD